MNLLYQHINSMNISYLCITCIYTAKDCLFTKFQVLQNQTALYAPWGTKYLHYQKKKKYPLILVFKLLISI